MAVLTLDSPPLNLFDKAMTAELAAALDTSWAADPR